MVRTIDPTGDNTKPFGELKKGDEFFVTPIVIGKVRCKKITPREGSWTCELVNAIISDRSHCAFGKIEFNVPDDEVVEIFPTEKKKAKG